MTTTLPSGNLVTCTCRHPAWPRTPTLISPACIFTRPPNEVSDQPVAIYRYDGVTSAVPAAFAADAWLASILSFEPSSLILLPMVAERAVRQTFKAPPGHPPQLPI
ncbi:MAG: hypothetical protein J4N64_03020 [Chloroflexi bacterium]|nr:hypothetical protein [Chloroflexota bacterium]